MSLRSVVGTGSNDPLVLVSIDPNNNPPFQLPCTLTVTVSVNSSSNSAGCRTALTLIPGISQGERDTLCSGLPLAITRSILSAADFTVQTIDGAVRETFDLVTAQNLAVGYVFTVEFVSGVCQPVPSLPTATASVPPTPTNAGKDVWRHCQNVTLIQWK